MRVLLVRHGQTDWNVQGLAQGHADIELNAEGRRQAKALARHLSGRTYAHVLSSDLKRCQQTLGPWLAQSGLEAELMPELRERTFGDMEGQDYVQLRAWMHQEAVRQRVHEYHVRPPNGESMHDVWNRMAVVVERLERLNGDTLVMSHGGALAQLLARLVKGTPETARSFRFSNTGCTPLWRRSDGYYVLDGLDQTDHLTLYAEDPALA